MGVYKRKGKFISCIPWPCYSFSLFLRLLVFHCPQLISPLRSVPWLHLCPCLEACICQHHITLHLGVSKHACDMTQRNTPVENILLREHMGRGGAQRASKRGSNTHGEESLKGKLRQRRNEEEDEVVGRER